MRVVGPSPINPGTTVEALLDEAPLRHELRHFGRDVVFEESLAFAATLVPEGELE